MLEVEEQKKNDLLQREEIKASIQEALVSEQELKILLAEKLKKNTELVVIKNIYPEFGSRNKKIQAYIYNTIEALKIFEPKKKEKVKKEVKEETPVKKPEVKKAEKVEEKKK